MGFSLYDSTCPARSLLQQELPMGLQPSLSIYLLWVGPSQTAGGSLLQYEPLWACRHTACLTMVFITDWRGISAPVPGTSPSPSSPLTLLCTELLLSHIFASLSSSSHTTTFCLKFVNSDMLPPLLMGLALSSARPDLEMAEIGSFGHEKVSISFLQKPPL